MAGRLEVRYGTFAALAVPPPPAPPQRVPHFAEAMDMAGPPDVDAPPFDDIPPW